MSQGRASAPTSAAPPPLPPRLGDAYHATQRETPKSPLASSYPPP
jgi:hypothetical protein